MTEAEIWRTAVVLVRRYGHHAPTRAELRQFEFIDLDDADGWALWVWIENATHELLRATPDRGETIH